MKSLSTETTQTTRRYELLCAVMLGFGQLWIMTGFDSETFLLESVIHSIHERDPERISALAGYYGQAVCYFAFMLTCLISSSIINVTGSKTVLLTAAICFTSFPIGFFFTNKYYYYISSAFLGIGFALFYQGQGVYLTSHSTRTTIESNVSMSWSIGCFCMVIGSGIMTIIITMTSQQEQAVIDDSLGGNENEVARSFSDNEIRLLFAALTTVSALGILTFVLLPSRDVDGCIESGQKKGSFFEDFKLTCSTLKSGKMLKLFPLFFLCGSYTSFWMSIVPTSMTFTKANAHMIYIPAIYSFGAGAGEILMGLAISFLSKRIRDFALLPTLIIGICGLITTCVLVLLSTPAIAPMQPTDDEPLLFGHSEPFVLILSFIVGLTDCCVNSVRGVICTLAMPKTRAQAFSVSKLYQAFGSCIVFFVSPLLNIYFYTIGLPIIGIISVALFVPVARSTRRMERKITTENLGKASAKV